MCIRRYFETEIDRTARLSLSWTGQSNWRLCVQPLALNSADVRLYNPLTNTCVSVQVSVPFSSPFSQVQRPTNPCGHACGCGTGPDGCDWPARRGLLVTGETEQGEGGSLGGTAAVAYEQGKEARASSGLCSLQLQGGSIDRSEGQAKPFCWLPPPISTVQKQKGSSDPPVPCSGAGPPC
jgi:hypothetical protein